MPFTSSNGLSSNLIAFWQSATEEEREQIINFPELETLVSSFITSLESPNTFLKPLLQPIQRLIRTNLLCQHLKTLSIKQLLAIEDCLSSQSPSLLVFFENFYSDDECLRHRETCVNQQDFLEQLKAFWQSSKATDVRKAQITELFEPEFIVLRLIDSLKSSNTFLQPLFPSTRQELSDDLNNLPPERLIAIRDCLLSESPSLRVFFENFYLNAWPQHLRNFVTQEGFSNQLKAFWQSATDEQKAQIANLLEPKLIISLLLPALPLSNVFLQKLFQPIKYFIKKETLLHKHLTGLPHDNLIAIRDCLLSESPSLRVFFENFYLNDWPQYFNDFVTQEDFLNQLKAFWQSAENEEKTQIANLLEPKFIISFLISSLPLFNTTFLQPLFEQLSIHLNTLPPERLIAIRDCLLSESPSLRVFFENFYLNAWPHHLSDFVTQEDFLNQLKAFWQSAANGGKAQIIDFLELENIISCLTKTSNNDSKFFIDFVNQQNFLEKLENSWKLRTPLNEKKISGFFYVLIGIYIDNLVNQENNALIRKCIDRLVNQENNRTQDDSFQSLINNHPFLQLLQKLDGKEVENPNIAPFMGFLEELLKEYGEEQKIITVEETAKRVSGKMTSAFLRVSSRNSLLLTSSFSQLTSSPQHQTQPMPAVSEVALQTSSSNDSSDNLDDDALEDLGVTPVEEEGDDQEEDETEQNTVVTQTLPLNTSNTDNNAKEEETKTNEQPQEKETEQNTVVTQTLPLNTSSTDNNVVGKTEKSDSLRNQQINDCLRKIKWAIEKKDKTSSKYAVLEALSEWFRKKSSHLTTAQVDKLLPLLELIAAENRHTDFFRRVKVTNSLKIMNIFFKHVDIKVSRPTTQKEKSELEELKKELFTNANMAKKEPLMNTDGENIIAKYLGIQNSSAEQKAEPAAHTAHA